MNDFTAIDFETAQVYHHTICQVGLVRVDVASGQVIKKISYLVQPPDNYFWYNFTELHGISAKDTAAAPTFDQLWPQIAGYIEKQHVVAHNGFSFDFDVLAKTLQHYNLPEPDYQKHCTYKIYRKGLESLCDEYQISLNHHDALSDACACAHLFLMHLKQKGNA